MTHEMMPPRAWTQPGPDEEDEIVRRIHDAVIEQRLPPGTKLSEAALCEAFGVGPRAGPAQPPGAGRPRDRGAPRQPRRLRGAADGGAGARRLRRAARHRAGHRAPRHRAGDRARPASGSASTSRRSRARTAHRDRRHAIRLSGHFHVHARRDRRQPGAASGSWANSSRRTSLIIGMFGERRRPTTAARTSTSGSSRRSAPRDEAAGATLMFEHLAHIEAGLDVSGKRSGAVNLAELFAREGSGKQP